MSGTRNSVRKTKLSFTWSFDVGSAGKPSPVTSLRQRLSKAREEAKWLRGGRALRAEEAARG